MGVYKKGRRLFIGAVFPMGNSNDLPDKTTTKNWQLDLDAWRMENEDKIFLDESSTWHETYNHAILNNYWKLEN